ncbi:hypothetical protein BC938DRAFT_480674 [Jimgerdemannia flammicorona]|uniref:Uncharacterized protein n=1 Tax=Jimgerdemannia flammicorona TaxID=994334 RepID=A0A433QI02_9FUNG|nr:hypothetical protein BC938DRAFT_480674 [Jimgerdemannia flammicorona]
MALITTNAPPLTKLVHVKHRALRKFCICINLRAGVIISCLVWAALGLYFAILAFQYQSPFYTYLNSTPLIVFGVLNLVMTFVGLFGVVAAALVICELSDDTLTLPNLGSRTKRSSFATFPISSGS